MRIRLHLKKGAPLLIFMFLGVLSFLLRCFRRSAERRSACVMYVAFRGSFRSVRVCWRAMWWVTHMPAYGGWSVLSCLSFSSFFLPLAAPLSLSLSLALLFSLSHLEPTEQANEYVMWIEKQGATAIWMGLGYML